MNKLTYVVVLAALFMMSSCSKDVKELRTLSPGLAWSKYLDGNNNDDDGKEYYQQHQAITSTSDNGFIIARQDSLAKYNEMGEKLSAKGFAYTIKGVQKTMNGFVVFGTNLTEGWLAQLDENLAVQWEISTATRKFNAVIEANDGYVITGTLDGNATIAKFSFSGNLEWEKSFERDGKNKLSNIQTTTDGFVAIGYSNTTALGEQFGKSDIWVVKLSSMGAVEWEHLYGNDSDDEGLAIHQTNEGFLVLCELDDFYESGLIRLDKNGTLITQRTFYHSPYKTMIKTDDEHFILGGYDFFSANEPFPTLKEGYNAVSISKVNQKGERIWELETGSSYERFSIYSVTKTSDNGYVGFAYDSDNSSYFVCKVNPE